ncbi:CD1375 family protein [Halalkalibacter oceani]
MLVTVYVTLVIAGRRTFEAVPANLKPGVEAELEALGLGEDGKPLEG